MNKAAKYKFLETCIVLILMLFLPPFFLEKRSYGLEQNHAELYQKFSQSYQKYQTLIDPFVTQKNQYLAYRSLQAQVDFLNSAKSLISAEVESIVLYVQFLKSILAEATAVLNYRENYLYVNLDKELDYFLLQQTKVASLSSLGETKDFLKDLQSHYQNVSLFAYQVKAIVEIYSVDKTLGNLKTVSDKIENYFGSQQNWEGNLHIDSAKEVFLKEKAELDKINIHLNTAREYESKLSTRERNKDIAKDLRREIDSCVDILERVNSSYLDVVNSLK